MTDTAPTVELDPTDVAGWAARPFEELFALGLDQVEGPQLAALARRFEALRPAVSALDKLADREGLDGFDGFAAAAPLLFDHRVYKSYPISIVERRQFDRLTGWLQRLTTHDLGAVPLAGVDSVDAWLERLDDNGMIMLHSTGTTGKLSFIPRSRSEWPGWRDAFFEATRAASGVDRRTEAVPTFYPGYRTGHTTGTKMQRIMGEQSAEGEAGRHVLYDYAISSDLLSLAARLRTAEERGEVEKLDIDPELLRQQAQLIEAGRRREQDLERWFTKLADEFRGRRVRINGVTGDLVRLALKGQAEGLDCEFAAGSVLFTSGGLKGLQDAPEDWEGLLRDFFDIERISSVYGMSECMGLAPLCAAGHYHFLPYTIPLLLDADGRVLPREGVQSGRYAFFDLLAETYWGGFITGDRITIHWDEDCACGWKGPRLEREIKRFSELEGGDDKISCAGTEEAYSEFMTYVSEI
ncbi:MAG: hypothetical protein QM729_12520 [Solirubrobacterales bacterium]